MAIFIKRCGSDAVIQYFTYQYSTNSTVQVKIRKIIMVINNRKMKSRLSHFISN